MNKDLILIGIGNKPDLVKPLLENTSTRYNVSSIKNPVETLMKTTLNKPKYIVNNHEDTEGLRNLYTALRRAGAIVNFIGYNSNTESWKKEELRK